MSKSIFVNLVIFTTGLATGFFVGKKYYEEHYAALAQEEIDSVKETFATYTRPVKVVENGITDEQYEECNKKEEVQQIRTNNNPLTRSSLDVNPFEQAKKNYNLVGIDLSNAENEDGPVTDAAGKSETEMDLTKVDRTAPYIINDQEFMEEFDHHDKVSLYYYRVDDVLCDEHEEIIVDVEGTIGYDAQEQLDIETTVWVRNEPLAIDYEVISLNKSYAELVHGIGTETKNLTPRERRLRSNKKRRD